MCTKNKYSVFQIKSFERRFQDSNVKTTQLGRKERTFCLCTFHVTEHVIIQTVMSSQSTMDGLNPLRLSSCILKHVCEFCEISNHMKSFKTSKIVLKGMGEVVSLSSPPPLKL